MNTTSTPTQSSPPCRVARSNSYGPQRGFTLIEALAVMAVASVLLGAAAPSMTSLVRSLQLSSASNDLLGSFLIARSESVKRGGRVVICKSSNGATCASTGGWEQGWIVFDDANNNGTRESNESLIQYSQALSKELRLTG